MSDENTAGESKFQKRQTALWMKIGDLLGGSFTRNEGFSAYKTPKGVVASRVNVFGVVLSKESSDLVESIFIEDETGSIAVKSFEKTGAFEKIEVGDIINVIGKIREYNNVPFISSEIIVKSEKGPFILRKKEIAVVQGFYATEETEKAAVPEEIVCDNSSKVLGLIRELDKGDGVDMDLLVEKCGMKNASQIIGELIRNGDVFEIMPGKIKVLD